MLVFSQYFSLNVHHLNDSIYIWNCCNQAQFLKKKIIMKCLSIKFFEFFKKYNCSSTHRYKRKIWVDIPSYISTVFYYCISNNLPREKNYNEDVTIQIKLFEIFFLTNYKFFEIKKVKVKSIYCCWLAFSFLFSIFFLLSLAMLSNLHVDCIFFEKSVFFVFKENTLKREFKLEKAEVKISRISNSKSPPWNLFKFRIEFFLVAVSRIMYWIFF